MSAWFKGLVLGVAAILGLSPAGQPPSLALRLYRDATVVYAAVEVEDMPGRDLARLVEADYTLRIEAMVSDGVTTSRSYRDIAYDGFIYRVFVSETSSTHKTDDAATAWALATRFLSIPLSRLDDLSFPATVTCSVAVSLPADDAYDPMVVWGYKAALTQRTLDVVGMVPYH
ncbi:MAG: hypothetical protein JXM71_02490 [Spirochaetales bacterium]|nr:hypothetical protein [Spirochaetales bacterium]